MCKSPNVNSRCLRVALKITRATLQLRVVYRRRPPQLIQTVTVGGACETALPFLVISCPLFRGTGFVRGMRGSPLPYPYRFKARGSVGDVVRSPYGVRTGNVHTACPYRFNARGLVGEVVRSPYGVRTGNVLISPTADGEVGECLGLENVSWFLSLARR